MKKKLFILSALLIAGSAFGQKRSKSDDMSIFADPLATTLANKVTKEKIANMNNPAFREVAFELLEGSFKGDYKVATYKAFLCPDELGRQLQIGDGYSKYENITGVYLDKGKNIVVANNIGKNGTVKIMIPNWDRRSPGWVAKTTEDPNGWGLHKDVYELKNGVNVIDIKKGGLVYVDYYSNTPEKENEIGIHFVEGKVNGYFDITKNNDADWDSLLNNAIYPVIDAKGRHVQIAYPVEACKKFASGRGVELISNYDSLIRRQHRFIGLEKYNKIPNNRILARVNYNYYMFRDGDGVAYMGAQPGYAMAMVVDPSRVISGDPCWGFSHEVGHVHQLRPYLNWGGLGEVSNNIVTMYVTRSYGIESRLAKQDDYNKVRQSVIEKGESYLKAHDAFGSLVPFWQLHLYFAANGKPDFYADLYEAFRSQESLGGEGWDGARGKDLSAQYQLNFVKKACEVGKTDLTEFFDKYGFFKIDQFEINDYGKYTYKMTQEMVDACKAEIAVMNLPKPTVDITTLAD